MYRESFYINTPEWNNAFSFDKRVNKKIFVPSLKKIETFDEIELWNEIVFEDYGFDDQLSTNSGLKNFYEMNDEKAFKFMTSKNQYIYDFHKFKENGYSDFQFISSWDINFK